jgi:hypothetical protein
MDEAESVWEDRMGVKCCQTGDSPSLYRTALHVPTLPAILLVRPPVLVAAATWP